MKKFRRQKVLKWLLVTCFESNTIVPVKEHEKLKFVRIGEYIDDLIDNHRDLSDISLIGVGMQFKTFFNPVKDVYRVDKNDLILHNIKFETGREYTVTGDHLCYILRDGKFIKKRADRLKLGEFVPIMLKSPSINPVTFIDVIEPLFQNASDSDLNIWRIQGERIGQYIIRHKDQIRKTMKLHHHEASFAVWKRSNLIPLRYFHILNIPKKEWSTLTVGRGRRGGGKIQWLPSSYELDSDLAFFLGYFIGDGSARENFLRLSIHGDDIDLVKWFSTFFSKRFGLKARTTKEKRAHMFTLQINSIALISLFKILDVKRTRALGKLKVPTPILNGTDEAIYGFFSGLIASDGNVHPTRNVIRIASCAKPFIEELCYLAGRIGLYCSIRSFKDGSIHELHISGEKNIQKLVKFGIIKNIDLQKINEKESKLRSRAWIDDFPIIESGLLRLAKHVRTARNLRLTGKERTARENVRTQIRKIKQRSHKLSSQDLQQLGFIEKLVNGDIGFAKITDISLTSTKSQYVYCFEVSKAFPGFVAATGGVFSHNSFGYTGYRNARFGRIESHEAISAYGRHTLTLAQKFAAHYDLEVIAGIVDSIWLKQADDEPIPIEVSQRLRQEVAELTGLPVEHAADYHWIVFLPRRHEPEIGVLNRYYGLKTDGKFKIRGIEIRQSSSPPFIKKLQTHMLTILAKARTGEQFQAATRRAYRLMKSYKDQLAEGNIPLKELLVTIRPSRAPNEYVNNSRQAIAARQLANAGVTVEPGVKITYLITNATAQDPNDRVKTEQLMTGDETYDLMEYRKLCTRAYESLIPPEFETKDPTLELFLDH